MITLLSIYQQVARQRIRKYKIFFKNIWVYKKKVLSLTRKFDYGFRIYEFRIT